MLRRLVVILAAVTVASLGSVPSGQTNVQSRATGPDILPVDGTLYGAYVEPDFHNGLERRTADNFFESLVGRPLAVERWYYTLDETDWPTADDYWSRDQGHILYLSWNGATGDGSEQCDWAGIAAGLWDASINKVAGNIKAFASPMIFSFHHEPTNAPPWHRSCGTGEDRKSVV